MRPKQLYQTVTLCGKRFTLYSLDGFKFDETIEIDDLNESDKGVYYFCRVVVNGSNLEIKPLYLGKSIHLEDRPLHKSHEKWPVLKKDGCNCIGIYKCKADEDPKKIESQILSEYNFIENHSENG